MYTHTKKHKHTLHRHTHTHRQTRACALHLPRCCDDAMDTVLTIFVHRHCLQDLKSQRLCPETLRLRLDKLPLKSGLPPSNTEIAIPGIVDLRIKRRGTMPCTCPKHPRGPGTAHFVISIGIGFGANQGPESEKDEGAWLTRCPECLHLRRVQQCAVVVAQRLKSWLRSQHLMANCFSKSRNRRQKKSLMTKNCLRRPGTD